MIESIKIKNFLSFKDEQEISFVASREISTSQSKQESWFTEIGGTRLLKMLVFIGNNGAGKTNALSAISYLRHLAVNSYSDKEEKPTYKPFLLDEDSRKQPTEITMYYYIGEERFSYRVVLNADYIVEESLILHNGRSTASVYKRLYADGRTVINFGNNCDLNSEDRKALVISTLNNSTVLASFGSKNLTSEILKKHYLYFRREIRMVTGADFDPMDLVEDKDALNQPAIKKVIIDLLHSVDAKINDYVLTEHVFDIPKEFLDDAPKSLIEQIRKNSSDGKIHKWDMNFYHQTSHGSYPIDVEMESRGILRIFFTLEYVSAERLYTISNKSVALLRFFTSYQTIILSKSCLYLIDKGLKIKVILYERKTIQFVIHINSEQIIIFVDFGLIHFENLSFSIFIFFADSNNVAS